MLDLLNAIDAIIEYMWDDEERDWEACGRPENHIFTHLKILDEFVKSVYQWVDERRPPSPS